MAEIKLSLKDSLYEDITVNLDGTKHKCKKFTKDTMDQYLEFEDKMDKASKANEARIINKLVYEQVKTLFPSIDEKELKKLHTKELFDIITLVENSVSARKDKPKTAKEKKAKNISRPGKKA